jgi:signal transduction histidine kinase
VHALKETQQRLRRSEGELRDALDRERERADELRELDETKNTFLSAVSHELRSPLTFILGTSSLLETRLDSLTRDEVVEMLGHTRRSAKKLQTLLDDLLDVERLRQGEISLERTEVDLASLTAEVVDDLGPRDDHRLIVDVPRTQIMADRSKLERVLSNLITNAFKYCPTDSRVWVRVERAGERVVIVVEDEGPGIATSDRTVIFDAFKRVNQGTSSGTGIGLLLVSKFAEMHGGRAWVEERPGGGASFRVSLPTADEEGHDKPPQAVPERPRLSVRGSN